MVTGAASGVGAGVAQVLAREGARVVIADSDEASAQRCAQELNDEGLVAIPVTVDVRDRLASEAAASEAIRRWGRIDILAANAGIYPQARLEQIDDGLVADVLGVNVQGAIHSIQACTPVMRAASYGRIVLTSSITGNLVGAEGYATYGASKAAMLGLMRSAALELVRDQITINAVLPGNVRTPGFEALAPPYREAVLKAIPMERLAEPEDVGWAVRFLASEEAGYITGQTLVLDGGQVLPESSA